LRLTLRWSPAASYGWLGAWLAFAAAVTALPFWWHIQYFKSPGPQFYRLVLASLPLLASILLAYPIARRRRLWRHEPAVLASALAAVGLLYEPVAMLVVLWMFAACYAVGHRVRQWLHLDTKGAAEDLSLSAAIGLGLLMFLLFWLGLAGGYYRATVAALLALPCLALWRDLRTLPGRVLAIFRRWSTEPEFAQPLGGILAVFAALLMACGTAVALAPSLTFDVLGMHLPAVQYYAARHILQPLPLLDYSYFPQGGEVLMTVAFLLGGQAAAQLLSPLCFLLVLLLLYATARRCSIGPLAAFAGCVLGASFPFLHWTGSVAKNDMLMALLQLTALYAYLRWRESRNFRWILAGVFLVAMSFAVKHVALFGAIPLGLFYLSVAWRQARRWRALAALVLVFAAFGLEWHVRTYVLTGNALYPETFHRGTTVLPGAPGLGRADRVLRFLAVPYLVHFLGRKAFESPSDNPAGVALIVLAPLVLLLRRKTPVAAERACLWFAALYLIYWASHAPVLRYAMAPLLILMPLIAARCVALAEALGRWAGGLLAGALAYSLLFSLCVAMILEINGSQFRYFAFRIDRSEYLREALRTYGSLESLRAPWKAGDQAFGVGNCSRAYSPDAASMGCYMPHRDVYSPSDAARILGLLHAHDYRFLIAPEDPIRQTIVDGLGPAWRAIPFYRDSYFTVYELSGASEPR
jgi:hypothetical protein